MSSLQKLLTFFFSKNICELDIVLTRTVNILTIYELVKLTMLWTTRPRSITYLVSLTKYWCRQKSGHLTAHTCFPLYCTFQELWFRGKYLGQVVQSVVSLTSSLRVISLTVLADSIYHILISFVDKMWVAFAILKLLTFFSKKFQHICVSLDVNFNASLTNDIVSFEQLGPAV